MAIDRAKLKEFVNRAVTDLDTERCELCPLGC
jgi:hypothetical protein